MANNDDYFDSLKVGWKKYFGDGESTNFFHDLKVGWKKYFGDMFEEFAANTTNILLPSTPSVPTATSSLTSLTGADYYETTEMPVMTTNGSMDYYYLDGNSTYNSTLGRVSCDSAFYQRNTKGDCVMTILTIFLILGVFFFVFGLVSAYAIKRLLLLMKRKDYEECIMMGHIPSVKVVDVKFSEETPIAYCKKTSANELTSQDFRNFLYKPF
ncbi:hypothetical protein HELRODRAFT_173269 [Helobdella robusta]|uniref:Uncharacterized protein n=1 Tax=Helobdella robusta TaxID=6412 RepID=T1F6M4_HELRO|nr:hypothetical protein HELRODRAFT_173269 [Helobdella robusta]ESO03566.1 hypothetical protein HELRODRAFT_173269 [Helobdella robusta]